jgi:hypothetical protein
LHGPPLHFSIPYDSLIEKCSTVSGSERQRDPQCLLLFKLSVGTDVT